MTVKQISLALAALLIICLSGGPLCADGKATLVNINTAGVDELTSLPRIGPSVANRIINYRKEHGAFERIEELMNVRGIGQKTFDRLKDLITVGDEAPSDAKRAKGPDDNS